MMRMAERTLCRKLLKRASRYLKTSGVLPTLHTGLVMRVATTCHNLCSRLHRPYEDSLQSNIPQQPL